MLAARLEAGLRAVATRDRAEHEKRYLKSDLQFLGVTVWQIRVAVREQLNEIGAVDHQTLVALVEHLWAAPIHERRMAAVVLLEMRSKLLSVADLALLERLIRESKTWALVDGLAGEVVGAILGADEEATVRTLDRWAADEDFWVRRSALLAWLRPLRDGAPLHRFLVYADAMLDEREFFIRKAIGWVLREAGKRRPDEVADWVAPRTHRASGVTIREATKYLSPAIRDQLMAAHRKKRPV
jgi:3-methyladenine DNA glycosylase AlkD